MTHDEYLGRDAMGLAALVRAGDVTPEELIDIAVARIDAIDPALNAVVRRMDEEARSRLLDADQAAPLFGVPFLAKDLIGGYAGHPTSGGSRFLKDLVISEDTELVRRTRATGVSVLGKTNLPEWGLLPVSESELWGPCRNPWDPTRTPGGSSGGSGAAVAAGMVPMASGGDGGGSIRIPASCCGLFGLKPTRARTPVGPDNGQLWHGAVVEHVLSRSVRDSALMLDLTHGPDPGAPFEIAPPSTSWLSAVAEAPRPLRIAWSTDPALGSHVDPACQTAVHETVALLEDLGHALIPAAPPIDRERFSRAFMTMVASELAADVREAGDRVGRSARRTDLEPGTWALTLLGRTIRAEEYALALRYLERVGRTVGAFFQDVDMLLTPTLATPPPPIGTVGPSPKEIAQLRLLGRFGSGRLVRAAGLLEEAAGEAFEFIPWTPIYNVTGQPAMSVPLHWTEDGLPVGVHFVGAFGDEANLFRLAGQLEQARPWFDRTPAVAHI